MAHPSSSEDSWIKSEVLRRVFKQNEKFYEGLIRMYLMDGVGGGESKEKYLK